MKERLNSVLSDKVEYNSIGRVENGMAFQVANIKNDDNFTSKWPVLSTLPGLNFRVCIQLF